MSNKKTDKSTTSGKQYVNKIRNLTKIEIIKKEPKKCWS